MCLQPKSLVQGLLRLECRVQMQGISRRRTHFSSPAKQLALQHPNHRRCCCHCFFASLTFSSYENNTIDLFTAELHKHRIPRASLIQHINNININNLKWTKAKVSQSLYSIMGKHKSRDFLQKKSIQRRWYKICQADNTARNKMVSAWKERCDIHMDLCFFYLLVFFTWTSGYSRLLVSGHIL